MGQELSLMFDGSTEELAEQLAHDPALATRRDDAGRTLLHRISFNSQFTPDQVELLLVRGCKVGELDGGGNTPLHHSRLRACTRALLRHGADPNARNAAGWTPIHTAASNGYTDLCALMVEAGGDINALTADGRSAWDLRFRTSDAERELLALGARAARGETKPTPRVKPRWAWFWSQFSAAADAPVEQRLSALGSSLARLDAAALVVFHQHLEHAIARGHARTISALAALLGEGGSDDLFEDFVAWLVSRGRRFYEAALKDPDALASESLRVDCGYDALLGVLFDAYARRTGGDGSAVLDARPESEIAFARLTERELPEWDDDALRRAFPKLFEMRGRR